MTRLCFGSTSRIFLNVYWGSKRQPSFTDSQEPQTLSCMSPGSPDSQTLSCLFPSSPDSHTLSCMPPASPDSQALSFMLLNSSGSQTLSFMHINSANSIALPVHATTGFCVRCSPQLKCSCPLSEVVPNRPNLPYVGSLFSTVYLMSGHCLARFTLRRIAF